ncbi:hypothetical protein [Brachybacterium sacelli]|uniref:hypothetical protein n=1 Tax=Brachybacterium sacelli TaxID=173364 RepID=UPI003621BA14
MRDHADDGDREEGESRQAEQQQDQSVDENSSTEGTGRCGQDLTTGRPILDGSYTGWTVANEPAEPTGPRGPPRRAE